MIRITWLLLLGGVGCQSAPPPAAPAGPPLVVRGQAPDEGPGAPDVHLMKAAHLLDEGQDAEAARHLESYVSLRPDQTQARAQLGELLYRLNRLPGARFHFELFIAQAQEQGERAFRYLIHSHSRLVEIAEEEQDGYAEHLHRGIGLYLLGCRRAAEADPDGDCSAVSIFCRAAAELQEARKAQPEEARPHLYLYHVWGRLGQLSAADRALAAADRLALLSRLTNHERRQIQMAALRGAMPAGKR
jgi:tetratricopeptide (TPR) repeat protein